MKKFLIIGLGLIGGSLAKSLKKLDFVEEICGLDSDFLSLEKAKNAKIITKITNFDENLGDFDLIIISCPLFIYEEIFENLTTALISCQKKPIIIDLGSVKEFAIKQIPQNLQENFIACHPIAGSELSGFDNSVDDLFFGKKFIICKNKFNKDEDVKKVTALFQKIGCTVDFIDAKLHDEIYALVSHLPQFISFLTKDFSPKIDDKAFRLNNSNEKIWGDIFALNEKNIEKFYIEFFENLMDFAQDLQDNKFDEIAIKMAKIAQILPKNDQKSLKIDKNQENLAKILFRLIIAAGYVKINKIKDYLPYAGSGFKDFTSILNLAQNEDLTEFLKDKKSEILGFCDEIS